MFLDSSSITSLATLLSTPPLGASLALIRAVFVVLEYGNRIHGDADVDAAEHLRAALRHLQQKGNDAETKLPHSAHACARILLALLSITRNTNSPAITGL